MEASTTIQKMSVITIFLLGIMLIPFPSYMLDAILALLFGLCAVIIITAKNIPRINSGLLLVWGSIMLMIAANIAFCRSILMNAHTGVETVSYLLSYLSGFIFQEYFALMLVITAVVIVFMHRLVRGISLTFSKITAYHILDGVAGRQMAINNDLAADLIDEKEAMARRVSLIKETNFFSAIDGLAKFINLFLLISGALIFVNIGIGSYLGIFYYGMYMDEALITFFIAGMASGLIFYSFALYVVLAVLMQVIGIYRDSYDVVFWDDEIIEPLLTRTYRMMYLGLLLIFLATVSGVPWVVLLLLGLLVSIPTYFICMRLGYKWVLAVVAITSFMTIGICGNMYF